MDDPFRAGLPIRVEQPLDSWLAELCFAVLTAVLTFLVGFFVAMLPAAPFLYAATVTEGDTRLVVLCVVIACMYGTVLFGYWLALPMLRSYCARSVLFDHQGIELGRLLPMRLRYTDVHNLEVELREPKSIASDLRSSLRLSGKRWRKSLSLPPEQCAELAEILRVLCTGATRSDAQGRVLPPVANWDRGVVEREASGHRRTGRLWSLGAMLLLPAAVFLVWEGPWTGDNVEVLGYLLVAIPGCLAMAARSFGKARAAEDAAAARPVAD